MTVLGSEDREALIPRGPTNNSNKVLLLPCQRAPNPQATFQSRYHHSQILHLSLRLSVWISRVA